MKKIIIFICILFCSSTIFAGNKAIDILDKTAKVFNACGDVKIDFTISTKAGSSDGTLLLSGKKFNCRTSGAVAWFNGTTLWHYVTSSDEVNVTNPKAADLAKINPYSFISLYKNGYECVMGNSTSNEYEVIMNGSNGSAYKCVVVRINKKTNLPSYVKMQTSKSETEITVKKLQKNQKFPANTFIFNKKEFPSVEMIDLR